MRWGLGEAGLRPLGMRVFFVFSIFLLLLYYCLLIAFPRPRGYDAHRGQPPTALQTRERERGSGGSLALKR